MDRLFRRTASIWEKEGGFSLLLAFLVGTLFVVPFLRFWFPVLAPASTAFFVVLLVTGVLVVSRSAWAALVTCILAGVVIALEITRQIAGADPFAAWRLGIACVTIGIFTVVTLARVFSPGPVTTHRLVGAVAAYLLVGLTWAYAYEWLEAVRPGSFQAGGSLAEGAYPAILYFSFVTLSTVGYGDVLPVGQAARALSNLESLIGVLYPAVLIGRLLSMHAVGAPPSDGPPGSSSTRSPE